MEILLWILAVILVAAGMAGLLFPALPGAPILFVGLVVAAWAEGFAHISTGTLIVLGVMALLMYLVDFLASAFGAKRFGASPRAINMLTAASRAYAALAGRDFVIPDDVKALFVPALRHRVVLAPGAEIEGLTADGILMQIVEQTAAPR